nr:MAG TPA: hypothetical protein [Caudoviricetes sp.]
MHFGGSKGVIKLSRAVVPVRSPLHSLLKSLWR